MHREEASSVGSSGTSSPVVWHYTTLGTLTNILESRTLYATEVNFLNDIHEPTVARTIFDRALEITKKSGIPNAEGFASFITSFLDHEERSRHSFGERILPAGSRFILCGSVNPDSLYAWRTYAAKGDVACAIALDRSVALRPKHLSRFKTAPFWRDVEYDEKVALGKVVADLKQMAVERDAALQAQGGDAMPPFDGVFKLAELEEYCKDPSFAYEEEARITYTEPDLRDLRFISHPMGPRPHLPLGVRDGVDTEDQRDGWNKLPILAVRLGPEAPDTAVMSAKWMLEVNGYSTVPVDGYQVDPAGAHVLDSFGNPIFSGPDYTGTVSITKSDLPFRTA